MEIDGDGGLVLQERSSNEEEKKEIKEVEEQIDARKSDPQMDARSSKPSYDSYE